MLRRVIARIVRKKYAPPYKDSYAVAELALLNSDGSKFGAPRYFSEFKDVADLLRRERATTREALQNAFEVYESGEPATIALSLRDDQIMHLGFRAPE